MEDLRVPKRRVSAEAILPTGAVRRITLFLAEAASSHTGPERPSDLLNGGGDFLPALDDDAGAMTFLNRTAVAAFRVHGRKPESDAEDLTLPTEHAVEVTFESGATLRGLISYLRPAERSRLVEFLNEPDRFFHLLEDQAVVLVNKRHVARVVLTNP